MDKSKEKRKRYDKDEAKRKGKYKSKDKGKDRSGRAADDMTQKERKRSACMRTSRALSSQLRSALPRPDAPCLRR
jgi:hypothetical protein